MRRSILAALAACLVMLPALAAPALTAAQSTADFDAFWNAVDTRHAYRTKGAAAWRKARQAWRPRAQAARSREALLAAMEGALATLHDDDVRLSERSPDAPRRVPDESDIWARWIDGRAHVEAVRTYGDADVAGLQPGDIVTRIDGKPVEVALREALGRVESRDPALRDRSLRRLLAGPRKGVMTLTVDRRGAERRLEIERRASEGAGQAAQHPLVARRIGEKRDLGYIRLKESLGDARLPERFDAAMQPLMDTRALILDLRETAEPGSRAVVEAILARFAKAPTAWQLRRAPGAPEQVDRIVPRGRRYAAPVVVLVDRWTAGEGEALAAGLVTVASARLVGTAMAGRLGEPVEVSLTHSGLRLRLPGWRTFVPDGTPREALRPSVEVDLSAPRGGPGDPILYQALKLLDL